MEPRFLPRDSGDLVTVMGIRHRIVATAEETGGACTLLELSLREGAGIPPHVHTREDEIFHVVEGRAEFLVGGARVEARAGATAVGPGGASKEPRGMLEVVTPGGLERFFGEGQTDASAFVP